MYGLSVIASVPPSTTSKTINRIQFTVCIKTDFWYVKTPERYMWQIDRTDLTGHFMESHYYCNDWFGWSNYSFASNLAYFGYLDKRYEYKSVSPF